MKSNQPLHILHYAEQGVHQCWNCKNCKGEIIYPLYVLDNESEEQLIEFLLPGCKVADQYMLYTTSIPCDKYEAISPYED